MSVDWPTVLAIVSLAVPAVGAVGVFIGARIAAQTTKQVAERQRDLDVLLDAHRARREYRLDRIRRTVERADRIVSAMSTFALQLSAEPQDLRLLSERSTAIRVALEEPSAHPDAIPDKTLKEAARRFGEACHATRDILGDFVQSGALQRSGQDPTDFGARIDRDLLKKLYSELEGPWGRLLSAAEALHAAAEDYYVGGAQPSPALAQRGSGGATPPAP